MPRANIFENLVTNENSLTELLCNLTRCSSFRRPFLARLLSDECSSHIAQDDIDTQERLDGCGQPDLIIRNDEVYALIEVKVRDDRGCTIYQPDGYFESLLRSKSPERWLVFVLPRGWPDRKRLGARLSELADSGGGIRTRIVIWEDVLEVIRESNLSEEPSYGPIFREFSELLSGWLIAKPIVFSKEEVRMLFSRDFAAAFSRLVELIKQLGDKGRSYKTYRPGSGFELYFKNNSGEKILWLGFWPDLSREHGLPLWFGVNDDWPGWVQAAFRETYEHETKRFQGWTLGWVPRDVFDGDNALEKIWEQVDPVLQAIVKADLKAAA
jgi:hypothetical protein